VVDKIFKLGIVLCLVSASWSFWILGVFIYNDQLLRGSLSIKGEVEKKGIGGHVQYSLRDGGGWVVEGRLAVVA
jgi:hypothetical protein